MDISGLIIKSTSADFCSVCVEIRLKRIFVSRFFPIVGNNPLPVNGLEKRKPVFLLYSVLKSCMHVNYFTVTATGNML